MPIIINNAATAKMIEDVSTLVLAGQAVPTRIGSIGVSEATMVQLRNAGRLVNRNKRKIAIATAALVVAGVLTGGVAVGVAVAGKAGGFIAGRIYRRWEMWSHMGKVKRLFPELTNEKGEFTALEFTEITNIDGSLNPKFKECMAAAEFMVAHRDFSDMVNAYIDTLAAKEKLDGQFAATVQIKDCTQAIEVLASMYKLKYHYSRVEAAFTFLDAYLVYISIRAKTIEEEFGSMAKRVFRRLKQQNPDPLGYLSLVANTSDVLHTAGRLWGDGIDQRAWVKAALKPFVQESEWGASHASVIAAGKNELNKGATANDKLRDQGGKLPIMAAKAQGGHAASSALKDAVGGMSSNVHLSAESAITQMTVGIVADVINSKINAEQLSRGKTIGFGGIRDLSSGERATLLKTKVKASFPRFNRKFEHLEKSHQEFLDNEMSPDQCTYMLRTRKHWIQTIGSSDWTDLWELHALVVGQTIAANNYYFGSEFENFNATTTRADELQGKIDEHIGRHQNGACSGGGCFCYMPVNLFLSQDKDPATSNDSSPIFPIGTSKFVEV